LKMWLHPRIIVISLSSLNSSREIGQVAFTGDSIFAKTAFKVALAIWAFVGGPAAIGAAAAAEAAEAAARPPPIGTVYNIENILEISWLIGGI
jgi:hypothetical protein